MLALSPFTYLIILSVVQGVTEFLPISSSAHLILLPHLLAWEDQGLVMDVAVHMGTLLAVCLYFWRDVGSLLRGACQLPVQGTKTPAAKLTLAVILATIPVVIAGYYLNDHDMVPRGIEVIAWATIGFGIVLYITDKAGLTISRLEHMKISSALVIGMAQILALIPGTSRSGITMSAARLLGFERGEAARFSMLLAIPTIIAAGSLKGYELWQSGDMNLTVQAGYAAGISFLVAWFAILCLMRWLRHATFTPFVVYRLVLGAGLLYWLYV